MESIFELESALADHITTRHFGRPTRLFDSLGSTQDQARLEAAAGAPHGTVVWALAQTAGRGRLNRCWVSKPGAGLWFSVLLRPPQETSAAALLSLAAGVGVARALRLPTAGKVRLKWPNDVLLEGRKLAGVLAEAETHAGTLSFVILGVGVNLERPPGLETDGAADAAALAEVAPGPIDAAVLMASLLAALETACDEAVADPAALRQAWLDLSDTIGRKVRAELGSQVLEGHAVDLDLDGSLVLERADGTRARVRAGEVVHLRPATGR